MKKKIIIGSIIFLIFGTNITNFYSDTFASNQILQSNQLSCKKRNVKILGDNFHISAIKLGKNKTIASEKRIVDHGYKTVSRDFYCVDNLKLKASKSFTEKLVCDNEYIKNETNTHCILSSNENSQMNTEEIKIDEDIDIKINGDMMEENELSHKYIDLGATWNDRSGNEGIVQATKILKEDIITHDFSKTTKIKPNEFGNYILKYKYISLDKESGKLVSSPEVIRYITMIEPFSSRRNIAKQMLCSETRLVCKDTIFGDKTWQLEKGDFCIGTLMKKVGHVCEPK